jgi:Pregnancy-associated plasma protein-A
MAEQLKRTCATMEQHAFLAQTDEVYRQNRRELEVATRTARLAVRTTVLRIPVVVHVIYHDEEDNLGVDQINSQIASLNRDYRFRNDDRSDIPAAFAPFATDTLIEFAMAVRDPQGNATTGITRTHTTKTSFPYDRSDPLATEKLDALIKFGDYGKVAWPRESYLNLWTCRITGGLLGYAQFPGGKAATDGVVINNTAFGSGGIASAPFNLGRTATHEVGHWLNLLHIWGDDGGGCSSSDNVDDTPNQSDSNGSDVKKSSFPHVSCNNAPNGDMFMNYMDYVDDDTMVMFTKGQLARMNATLSGPRALLAASKGLTPVLTERIDVPVASRRNHEGRMFLGDESGQRPKKYFDGVSWVDSE